MRRRISPVIAVFAGLGLLWGSLPGAAAQAVRPVVVLSPGHGWWSEEAAQIDPGACHPAGCTGDLVEKTLTLDVAIQAREFLSRCPVEVYLTREADDPTHTLSDVDEIVNGYTPTLSVSIHANSSGNTAYSATEAWHTVGTRYDDESQRLAMLLAQNVSERMGLQNDGIKPETANRHGGLYIHYWNAPSALVELAYVGGDAELLRHRRRDFARSVAQAILNYLDLPVTCADRAIVLGTPLSVHFPGETHHSRVELQNDGLASWPPGGYVLSVVGDAYGAEANYPLRQEVKAGESGTWDHLPATAPALPGVYRQTWQLQRGGDLVAQPAEVILVVLPEQARELRERVEQQIQEWREQGEQEQDELLERIQLELQEWLEAESERWINACTSQGLALAIGILGFAWYTGRKTQTW